MSTSARKARKKAGIPFTKPTKEATPFFARASFIKLTEKEQERIADDRGFELTAKSKETLAALRPPRTRQVRNYAR